MHTEMRTEKYECFNGSKHRIKRSYPTEKTITNNIERFVVNVMSS